MNLLQMWTIVGVPALAVAFGLFAGRSPIRATAGFLVLLALVVLFAITPGGGMSAAAVGLTTVFLVATGRGTHVDREYPEHHENRKRFTTATRRQGG